MAPTFNPKVDVFMPLYIGKYLQDTTSLDATESGAYLHLLMHQWVAGPLPNDDKKLAIIARLTPDAWSIAKASVMHFMFLGTDRLWHQRALERIKAEWTDKRQKAHDKASKAAQTRWKKYREGKANKTDAPSTARAMPYIQEVQVQKQIPTPTPPAAQEGMKPKTGPMLQAPQTKNARHRGAAIAPANAQATRKKSENSVKGGRTRPKRDGDTAPAKKSGEPATVKEKYVAPRLKAKNFVSGPQKLDPLEQILQEEVFAYWRSLNPEHPDCPWGELDWRALRALLIRVPELSLAEFKRLLHNRASSEVSASAHPYKWLRSLLEYSSGPLGPFGKPLRSMRVM